MGRWYSHVGEVLGEWKGTFGRGGLPTGMLSLWAKVVGDDAAAHSRPVRLTRKGVLTVAVSDGGWSQELSFLQSDILDKLQELQEKPVVSLRFHLAPAAFEKKVSIDVLPPEGAPVVTMQEFEKAASIATGFKNERIRDALLSALMRRMKPGGW